MVELAGVWTWNNFGSWQSCNINWIKLCSQSQSQLPKYNRKISAHLSKMSSILKVLVPYFESCHNLYNFNNFTTLESCESCSKFYWTFCWWGRTEPRGPGSGPGKMPRTWPGPDLGQSTGHRPSQFDKKSQRSHQNHEKNRPKRTKISYKSPS